MMLRKIWTGNGKKGPPPIARSGSTLQSYTPSPIHSTPTIPETPTVPAVCPGPLAEVSKEIVQYWILPMTSCIESIGGSGNRHASQNLPMLILIQSMDDVFKGTIVSYKSRSEFHLRYSEVGVQLRTHASQLGPEDLAHFVARHLDRHSHTSYDVAGIQAELRRLHDAGHVRTKIFTPSSSDAFTAANGLTRSPSTMSILSIMTAAASDKPVVTSLEVQLGVLLRETEFPTVRIALLHSSTSVDEILAHFAQKSKTNGTLPRTDSTPQPKKEDPDKIKGLIGEIKRTDIERLPPKLLGLADLADAVDGMKLRDGNLWLAFASLLHSLDLRSLCADWKVYTAQLQTATTLGELMDALESPSRARVLAVLMPLALHVFTLRPFLDDRGNDQVIDKLKAKRAIPADMYLREDLNFCAVYASDTTTKLKHLIEFVSPADPAVTRLQAYWAAQHAACIKTDKDADRDKTRMLLAQAVSATGDQAVVTEGLCQASILGALIVRKQKVAKLSRRHRTLLLLSDRVLLLDNELWDAGNKRVSHDASWILQGFVAKQFAGMSGAGGLFGSMARDGGGRGGQDDRLRIVRTWSIEMSVVSVVAAASSSAAADPEDMPLLELLDGSGFYDCRIVAGDLRGFMAKLDRAKTEILLAKCCGPAAAAQAASRIIEIPLTLVDETGTSSAAKRPAQLNNIVHIVPILGGTTKDLDDYDHIVALDEASVASTEQWTPAFSTSVSTVAIATAPSVAPSLKVPSIKPPSKPTTPAASFRSSFRSSLGGNGTARGSARSSRASSTVALAATASTSTESLESAKSAASGSAVSAASGPAANGSVASVAPSVVGDRYDVKTTYTDIKTQGKPVGGTKRVASLAGVADALLDTAARVDPGYFQRVGSSHARRRWGFLRAGLVGHGMAMQIHQNSFVPYAEPARSTGIATPESSLRSRTPSLAAGGSAQPMTGRRGDFDTVSIKSTAGVVVSPVKSAAAAAMFNDRYSVRGGFGRPMSIASMSIRSNLGAAKQKLAHMLPPTAAAKLMRQGSTHTAQDNGSGGDGFKVDMRGGISQATLNTILIEACTYFLQLVAEGIDLTSDALPSVQAKAIRGEDLPAGASESEMTTRRRRLLESMKSKGFLKPDHVKLVTARHLVGAIGEYTMLLGSLLSAISVRQLVELVVDPRVPAEFAPSTTSARSDSPWSRADITPRVMAALNREEDAVKSENLWLFLTMLYIVAISPFHAAGPAAAKRAAAATADAGCTLNIGYSWPAVRDVLFASWLNSPQATAESPHDIADWSAAVARMVADIGSAALVDAIQTRTAAAAATGTSTARFSRTNVDKLCEQLHRMNTAIQQRRPQAAPRSVSPVLWPFDSERVTAAFATVVASLPGSPRRKSLAGPTAAGAQQQHPGHRRNQTSVSYQNPLTRLESATEVGPAAAMPPRVHSGSASLVARVPSAADAASVLLSPPSRVIGDVIDNDGGEAGASAAAAMGVEADRKGGESADSDARGVVASGSLTLARGASTSPSAEIEMELDMQLAAGTALPRASTSEDTIDAGVDEEEEVKLAAASSSGLGTVAADSGSTLEDGGDSLPVGGVIKVLDAVLPVVTSHAVVGGGDG
ncbi:hypothetical protein H9P43_002007 [Blastocladiella emersonii ATCC 22665]|nr:hypothetical protein H9P43_002007 [Blastocladiella emersonii ATCC 22665]